MKQRFKELLYSLNIPSELVNELSEKIIQTYSHSSRNYHNLIHIAHCLDELDRLPKNLKIDRIGIELAIWYHDVVYNPKRSDNEEKSAEVFYRDFKNSLNSQILSNVKKMILQSNHQNFSPSSDLNLNLFLDIDMSILGQSDEKFTAYERDIRAEYKAVPKPVFFYYRKSFLKKLLRTRVYKTDYFFEKYESRAKENISKLLHKFPYFMVPVLST